MIADIVCRVSVAMMSVSRVGDCGHCLEGFNNNFLSITLDYIAFLYNDKSILENHNLAAEFDTLMRPEYNFTANMSTADFRKFRSTVIELVLATDLAGHFEILSLFKSKVIKSWPKSM